MSACCWALAVAAAAAVRLALNSCTYNQGQLHSGKQAL